MKTRLLTAPRSQGLISEVIVPLLSMQQSCLLCISTLLESGNRTRHRLGADHSTHPLTALFCAFADYSRMFELKDPLGEPLFETISITLVCDDCLKTGKQAHTTTMLAHLLTPRPFACVFTDHPELYAARSTPLSTSRLD